MTSRCESSTSTAPSVAMNSMVPEETCGWPGGRARRARLGVGVPGIEPLGVAEAELGPGGARRLNQLVGVLELEADGLLEQHVLARHQAVARERIVGRFRRGRDDDGVDVGAGQQLTIIGGRGPGPRLLGHTLEPGLVDLAEIDRKSV